MKSPWCEPWAIGGQEVRLDRLTNLVSCLIKNHKFWNAVSNHSIKKQIGSVRNGSCSDSFLWWKVLDKFISFIAERQFNLLGDNCLGNFQIITKVCRCILEAKHMLYWIGNCRCHAMTWIGSISKFLESRGCSPFCSAHITNWSNFSSNSRVKMVVFATKFQSSFVNVS